jgi:hypothetical protein
MGVSWGDGGALCNAKHFFNVDLYYDLSQLMHKMTRRKT